jgi:hypothetical protein
VNWDRKTADFFVALGNFYCARPSDPVIVKIKRNTFARVYDLRKCPTP